MPLHISIRDEIGRFCVSQEDGAALRALAEPALLAGEPVVLDFEGVEGHLTVFYNEAVGRLFDTVGAEAVDRLLSVEGLDDLGTEVYQHSVHNARRLSALSDAEREAFHKSVDDILEDDR